MRFIGMPQVVDIISFLEKRVSSIPIIDVRSPGEFLQGHIPGSVSLPLFSDEERAEVGTLYKVQGPQSAVMRGLEIIGPKMAYFASVMASYSVHNELRFLCWRGGMRSESMAWLGTRIGISPIRLQGGYKAFRTFVLKKIDERVPAIVISGYTGSGKTECIQKLCALSAPAIDLEKLACHRGSAFGQTVESVQSQEQFENRLVMELEALKKSPHIIFEDESRMIGLKVIPKGVWESLQNPIKVFFLDIPKKVRLERIIEEYGKEPIEKLQQSVMRLEKKLGSEKTRWIEALLNQGDIPRAADLLLDYYDAAYRKSMARYQKNIYHSISSCDELIDILHNS